MISHWNLSDDYIETETAEQDEEEDSFGSNRFVELILQCQECKNYNDDIESVCLYGKGRDTHDMI